MRNLEGKTAIVFGGTGGIGKAKVRGILAAGGNVVAVARTPEDLDLLAESLDNPKSLITVAADAAIQEDVDRVVGEALRKFTTIHIVFISIGDWDQNFPDTNPEDLEKSRKKLHKSLVLAVENICKTVAPIFEVQGEGTFIHVSSHAVHKPEEVLPGNYVYREKKIAAEAVVNSFKSPSVRIVNLRPSIVRTPKNNEALTRGGKDLREQAVQPEDIAEWCIENFDKPELPNVKIFDSGVVV